jgi:hypothetical protein
MLMRKENNKTILIKLQFDWVKQNWFKNPNGLLSSHIVKFAVLALFLSGCGLMPQQPQTNPISWSEETTQVSVPEEAAFESIIPSTGKNDQAIDDHSETLEEVGQWTLYEITLTSSRDYSNPFTDVDVYADFTHQDKQVRVYGFYDGDGEGGQGNLWKIRFMTGELGTWSWQTTSTDANNQGLHNITGSYVVIESNEPGPIRPDPEYPNAWIHESGDHFYWSIGYSIHILGADKTHPGVGGWLDYLEWLDRRDFNGVMFTLQVPSFKACTTCWKGVAPWSAIGDNTPPKYAFENAGKVDYFVMPWANKNDPNATARSATTAEFSRFYLPLWQKLDELLADMQAKGMIAHILQYSDETFWPPASSAEETLYWDYILRRTGAYWNVVYNDGIDLNEYRNLRTWVPEWQNYFQDNDPFEHPRSSRHGDDDLQSAVWRSVQAANSTQPRNVDQWRLLMNTGPRKPVTEDDGIRALKDSGINPERFMQLAWWSVLAGPGGFGATWAGPYEPGNWYSNLDQDSEGMLRVGIRNKFIFGSGGSKSEQIPFWKLETCDQLVNGEGVYCSAVLGEHYLVYFDTDSPDRIVIDLIDATSTLSVTWLNPANGDIVIGQPWKPGVWANFKNPFNGPAVLYLKNEATFDLPVKERSLFIPYVINRVSTQNRSFRSEDVLTQSK